MDKIIILYIIYIKKPQLFYLFADLFEMSKRKVQRIGGREGQRRGHCFSGKTFISNQINI